MVDLTLDVEGDNTAPAEDPASERIEKSATLAAAAASAGRAGREGSPGKGAPGTSEGQGQRASQSPPKPRKNKA